MVTFSLVSSIQVPTIWLVPWFQISPGWLWLLVGLLPSTLPSIFFWQPFFFWLIVVLPILWHFPFIPFLQEPALLLWSICPCLEGWKLGSNHFGWPVNSLSPLILIGWLLSWFLCVFMTYKCIWVVLPCQECMSFFCLYWWCSSRSSLHLASYSVLVRGCFLVLSCCSPCRITSG